MTSEFTFIYESNHFPSLRDSDLCRRFEITIEVRTLRGGDDFEVSWVEPFDLERDRSVSLDVFPPEERKEILERADRIAAERAPELAADRWGERD